jgi:hypothetical protein
MHSIRNEFRGHDGQTDEFLSAFEDMEIQKFGFQELTAKALDFSGVWAVMTRWRSRIHSSKLRL